MNPAADKVEPGDQEPSGSRLHPLFWLTGLAGVGLLSRWIIEWDRPLPLCGFRKLTGVPCPLCGGTRAVESLTDLDLGTALSMNPLVCLGTLALIAWLFLGLADHVLGSRLERRLTRSLARLPLAIIGFGLLLLNWAYRVFFLP